MENEVDARHPTSVLTPTPYLDVPVLIQVIDTCDAAPITVGIVNVPHVPQPVAWVTRHHGLAETDGSGLLELGRDIWGSSHCLLFLIFPAPHLRLTPQVSWAPRAPAPKRSHFLAKPPSTENLSSRASTAPPYPHPPDAGPQGRGSMRNCGFHFLRITQPHLRHFSRIKPV